MRSTTARRLLAVTAASGLALAIAPAASASTSAVAACPRPGPSGNLTFTTTLSNGVTKLGRSATITGSTAKGCGFMSVRPDGKLGATIRPQNIQFAPVTTKVGLLSLPTTLKATSNITGPVAFTAGGQTASLTGSILATAEVLGQKCSIPIRVTLTTGKSGALTGTKFQFQPDDSSKGKLVANNFPVPKIAASDTCNLLVAASSNALIGLPLAAGESSITYDGSIKIG